MSVSISSPSVVRPQPGADQIAYLRARLAGQLITASSADYTVARTTLYGGVRSPLAVARVLNVADVVTVVGFARDHGLPLSVRSGGHSLAGDGVIDDAVVIDFSDMKAVVVDPEARTARVQAGATSADIAGPANAHGLALSTGDTHSVGIGGLATGGGIGFMVRKYGMTIDNLLEAQVVTAGGEVVIASATEHPELFWAIRGGGGNFGVITEFTFRLAEVPQVLGGALILPATRETLRGYLEQSIAAPDDLTTIANVMHLPPLPFVAPERVGEVVLLMLVTWSGDADAGQQALAPFRALAEPVADVVGPMPYPAMFELTAEQAEPHSVAMRTMFADDLSDAALDAVLEAVRAGSSPMSLVQLRGLGGAFARVPNAATAFAHRDRRYLVAAINLWFDPSEDRTPHEAWTEAIWATLRDEAQGAYVNFIGNEEPERLHDAYPGDTLERLRQVKRAWDPENLFRHNKNIAPAP